LQIPFSQLKIIHQVDTNDKVFALVISLESPPEFFRKKEDDRATHSSESPMWTEFDCWFRQTDIVYDPSRLRSAPVALPKETPVIDIGNFENGYYAPDCSDTLLTKLGRWMTYRFEFLRSQNNTNVYNMIRQALQDFNIEVLANDQFHLIPQHTAQLWSFLDPPKSQYAADELQYLEDSSRPALLPFEVRYQLEVCISWGILNEHNITEGFLMRLAEMASKDSSKARTILEYTAEKDNRIYDPMTIFDDEEALAYSSKTEIPAYTAYSRKATITPTRVYFSSPTVEVTNRVLRHYARENRDGRFLRVQFTDELSQVGELHSGSFPG
jgi:RNA-dependent RNA polymerase